MIVIQKLGVAGIGLLLGGVCCALGAWSPWFNDLHKHCHHEEGVQHVHDRRAYLNERDYAAEPTDAERQLAQRALQQWSRAAKEDRPILVDQILIGHALDGMDNNTLIESLGKPRARNNDTLTYDVTAFNENSGSLIVELDSGRVKKAFLRVSYMTQKVAH